MNTVDIIIVGVFILSALVGFLRGLTREVLGLASWLGSCLLTYLFMPLVQNIAKRYVEHNMASDIFVIIILFILFLILFSFISTTLSNFVKYSMFGGIDRSLGGIYGLARGMFLLSLVEIGFSVFLCRNQYPIMIQQSHMASFIYPSSDFIMAIMPNSLKNIIAQHQQKIVQNNSPLLNSAQQNLQELSKTAQQEMEALARLKPKSEAANPSGFSKKQAQDLDRLLMLDDEPQEIETQPATPNTETSNQEVLD